MRPDRDRTRISTRRAAALLMVGILVLGYMDASAAQDEPSSEASPEARAEALHAGYSDLLQEYVRGVGVDYLGWASDYDDLRALREYTVALAAFDPEDWAGADAVAYWINAYNALTLLLILEHYPIDSIKDLDDPWGRVVLATEQRGYSLDQIEKDVLLRITRDARIHFAVNCASVGCPPLWPEAFVGSRLDEQLEAATTAALQLETQLVVVEDTVVLSKIFGWYERDFEDDAGSVANFIERYRDDLPEGDYKIQTMDYDWSLNDVADTP